MPTRYLPPRSLREEAVSQAVRDGSAGALVRAALSAAPDDRRWPHRGNHPARILEPRRWPRFHALRLCVSARTTSLTPT